MLNPRYDNQSGRPQHLDQPHLRPTPSGGFTGCIRIHPHQKAFPSPQRSEELVRETGLDPGFEVTEIKYENEWLAPFGDGPQKSYRLNIKPSDT